MALTACRECGQQVSTEASACPHCGVPDPLPESATPTPSPPPKPPASVIMQRMFTTPEGFKFLGLIALLAVIVIAVIAAAVSGGSPTGCSLATDAVVVYGEANRDVGRATSTPTDLATAMQEVQKKLDDVALIADSPLQEHASSAALSAGRLRVAFLGQGNADIESDTLSLRDDMEAIAEECS